MKEWQILFVEKKKRKLYDDDCDRRDDRRSRDRIEFFVKMIKRIYIVAIRRNNKEIKKKIYIYIIMVIIMIIIMITIKTKEKGGKQIFAITNTSSIFLYGQFVAL